MAEYMLLAIDDLTRHNYTYLSPEDECYYLCEYFPRMGFLHSPENQLIYNFKKPIEKRGASGYHYKDRAIIEISEIINNSVLNVLDANATTIIPIPPSKTKSHIHYDDRLLQVLNRAVKETCFDVRELIIQKSDMDAAHESTERPRPETLKFNYEIDTRLIEGLKDLIILFDDVLTTGAHFIACRDLIKELIPNKRIVGIFIARCNRQYSINTNF